MQSTKAAQEFKTVYETKTRAPWELRHFTDGEFSVYESLHSHYACSDLLRLDARVHINGLAVFKMTCMHMEAIFDAIKKFCGDAYKIVKIEMRLNAQEFDRWIAVPKEMTLIRLHEKDVFGLRYSNGHQSEEAGVRAVNLRDQLLTAFGKRVVTHIYIPSSGVEIPIYPCEPHGVKKVDPKASAPKVTADTKATYEDAVAKRYELKLRRKDLTRRIQELQQEQGKVDVQLAQSKIDLNTNYGPWPQPHHIPDFDAAAAKADAVTQTGKDLVRQLADKLGIPIDDLGENAWSAARETLKFSPRRGLSFLAYDLNSLAEKWREAGQRNAERAKIKSGPVTADEFDEMWAKNAADILKNPATVKAAIERLLKEGDRETLTTLYRLTNTALFKMHWDEATARKSGDDKGRGQ